MAITTIVRSKGGTRKREILLSDIVIPDVRIAPLFLPDERWIGAVSRYYDDLHNLLAAVREDRVLPSEFFVPDLWHTTTKLSTEEKELMLDMWHLGYDLANAVGYTRGDSQDPVRNNVGGTVLVLAAGR